MTTTTLSAIVGVKVSPDVCNDLGCLGFSVTPGGEIGPRKSRKKNKDILLVLGLPSEIEEKITLTKFNEMALEAEKIVTQYGGRFLF